MKKKFAVIVGNDVVGTISIHDTSLFERRQIAAMLSNPEIIETDDVNVGPGWIWDGTNFESPGA